MDQRRKRKRGVRARTEKEGVRKSRKKPRGLLPSYETKITLEKNRSKKVGTNTRWMGGKNSKVDASSKVTAPRKLGSQKRVVRDDRKEGNREGKELRRKMPNYNSEAQSQVGSRQGKGGEDPMPSQREITGHGFDWYETRVEKAGGGGGGGEKGKRETLRQ